MIYFLPFSPEICESLAPYRSLRRFAIRGRARSYPISVTNRNVKCEKDALHPVKPKDLLKLLVDFSKESLEEA